MGNVPLERLTSDRIERIYEKHVTDSRKGMDANRLMKAFEEVTEVPLTQRQAAKVLEKAAKAEGGEFSDSLSKEVSRDARRIQYWLAKHRSFRTSFS